MRVAGHGSSRRGAKAIPEIMHDAKHDENGHQHNEKDDANSKACLASRAYKHIT